MELWKEEVDEALGLLLNELTMVQPPMWMYAALPSAAALERARKARVGPAQVRVLGGSVSVW